MSVDISVGNEQSAWDQLRGLLGRLSNDLNRANQFMANNDVSVEFGIYQVYKRLDDDQTTMNALAAVPGLDAFVQDLVNNGTYVATTELAAISTAIDTAKTWLDTNIGGLSLTGDTASNALTNGSVATNRFTSVQTAQLQTDLEAIRTLIVAP